MQSPGTQTLCDTSGRFSMRTVTVLPLPVVMLRAGTHPSYSWRLWSTLMMMQAATAMMTRSTMAPQTAATMTPVFFWGRDSAGRPESSVRKKLWEELWILRAKSWNDEPQEHLCRQACNRKMGTEHNTTENQFRPCSLRFTTQVYFNPNSCANKKPSVKRFHHFTESVKNQQLHRENTRMQQYGSPAAVHTSQRTTRRWWAVHQRAAQRGAALEENLQAPYGKTRKRKRNNLKKKKKKHPGKPLWQKSKA